MINLSKYFGGKNRVVDWDSMEKEDQPWGVWLKEVKQADQLTLKLLHYILDKKIAPDCRGKFLAALGEKKFNQLFGKEIKNQGYQAIAELFDLLDDGSYQLVAKWVAKSIRNKDDLKVSWALFMPTRVIRNIKLPVNFPLAPSLSILNIRSYLTVM